jgi:hypothetical protein
MEKVLVNVCDITHVKPLSKMCNLQLQYVNCIILVDGPEFDFKEVKRFFSSSKSPYRLWDPHSLLLGGHCGFFPWE